MLIRATFEFEPRLGSQLQRRLCGYTLQHAETPPKNRSFRSDHAGLITASSDGIEQSRWQPEGSQAARPARDREELRECGPN